VPVTDLSRGELDAIATYLRTVNVPTEGPLNARLIAGGRSNLTFELRDRAHRWVLRTPPRSGRTPSAHDVIREYRVTSALAKTDVPVPAPVAAYDREDLIGGAFAISEFVEARTVQTREQLDLFDDETVGLLTRALVEALATLHRVDHVAAGLELLGRPDGYAARQLKRWSGQWEIVGQKALTGLEAELRQRLHWALPEQKDVSVVHGDYRIDNTMIGDGVSSRIAAIVDWELSTIGDPVADVAMMCAYRAPIFDLVIGTPAAWTSSRLPDIDSLASHYLQAGGVDLNAWEFHLALAYYKVAVIAAGIDHRYQAGFGSGPGFDSAGAAVEEYFHLALQAAPKRRFAAQRPDLRRPRSGL
jgi:aminoglycoside phosphotransferase (APT) family kinase protein